MSGNVYEWCQDIYSPYTEEEQYNPKGAEQGKQRVLRGGSYYSDAASCAHTSRCYKNESTKEYTFGLRLALDA
jgi:formylglycine-generating enzyme required for sulfatase activity